MREQFFLIAVAIVIGVLCGFGGVGFRYLVDLVHVIYWGEAHISPSYLSNLSWWRLALSPALGGLLVGPIVFLLVREAKGHGVPEVMAAVTTRDGVIQGRVAVAKAVTSSITIGSGGSAGPEGPIIQIGAAIGSKVGQIFGVSRKRLRTFVACGAAGGLAATFNAPIAGSLFAVEVILRQFGVSQFSPIVISSVISTVISRHFLGGGAVFSIPEYELASILELGPYLLLGVLCGVLSIVMIRSLYWSEDWFARFERVPGWIKPAIGGLALGGIGWAIPHVYGDGEFVINMILHDQLAWWMLAALVGAKLLATALTLGSGGSGGVFAPSLFIGAAAGGALGHAVGALLGPAVGAPGGYALVGMGGLIAGTIHAPITAIIMIFEITDSYQIILPLMLVCIISIIMSTHFHPESIYTTQLIRQGIDLFRGQSLDVLKEFRVHQVLHRDCARVSPDTSVENIEHLVMEGEHTHFYVTRDDGHLLGVVLVSELSRVLMRRQGLEQVLLAEDLAHEDTPVCTTQESLSRALLKFEQSGLPELPVVNGAVTRILVGVVRYREVIAVYNNEILKRDTADELASRLVWSERIGKVKLVDGFSMEEWDPTPTMWGKTLAELRLPTRYGVRVLLVKRSPKAGVAQDIVPVTPGPDFRIQKGDSFILYGSDESLLRVPRA